LALPAPMDVGDPDPNTNGWKCSISWSKVLTFFNGEIIILLLGIGRRYEIGKDLTKIHTFIWIAALECL